MEALPSIAGIKAVTSFFYIIQSLQIKYIFGTTQKEMSFSTFFYDNNVQSKQWLAKTLASL